LQKEDALQAVKSGTKEKNTCKTDIGKNCGRCEDEENKNIVWDENTVGY